MQFASSDGASMSKDAILDSMHNMMSLARPHFTDKVQLMALEMMEKAAAIVKDHSLLSKKETEDAIKGFEFVAAFERDVDAEEVLNSLKTQLPTIGVRNLHPMGTTLKSEVPITQWKITKFGIPSSEPYTGGCAMEVGVPLGKIYVDSEGTRSGYEAAKADCAKLNEHNPGGFFEPVPASQRELFIYVENNKGK